MKQKNIFQLFRSLFLLLAITFVFSSCERQFDIPWPQTDLKIYKIEAGAKAEITAAKVGQQVIFAKPEQSVTDFNRIFRFSLWTGDEGHDYDKIYSPGQSGLTFPGLELPYTYTNPGTYNVVYVISYYNVNDKELERQVVTKTITITQ